MPGKTPNSTSSTPQFEDRHRSVQNLDQLAVKSQLRLQWHRQSMLHTSLGKSTLHFPCGGHMHPVYQTLE